MMLVTEELRLNEVVLQLRHMVDVVRDQLARVLQSYERGDVALALCVAQGPGNRRPQYRAVQGTPHLYDGGPTQHDVLYRYAVLRKEH